MILRRSALFGIILAICLCAACNSRPENSDFIFIYGNEQPEDAIRSQSMLFFEEELEKRSDGRIQVEVFFGGVLGNEREMMDQVTTGLIQGTRGGMFMDASPLYSIYLLPFLVDDWDQMLCLLDSDFTRRAQSEALENGYHIPATGISQGFRAHTNNIRPIEKLEDLKGLKMRVPQQIVYIETAKALGVNPLAMPFTDAYHAFKTGVIDGQDNAIANLWAFKIYEVQKYMTVTNYSTGPDPLIVNQLWYERLPPDLKKVFDDVSVETLARSNSLYRQTEKILLDKLEAHMEINTVDEKALIEFRNAVAPVYDTFIAKGVFSQTDVEMAKTAARSCAREDTPGKEQ